MLISLYTCLVSCCSHCVVLVSIGTSAMRRESRSGWGSSCTSPSRRSTSSGSSPGSTKSWWECWVSNDLVHIRLFGNHILVIFLLTIDDSISRCKAYSSRSVLVVVIFNNLEVNRKPRKFMINTLLDVKCIYHGISTCEKSIFCYRLRQHSQGDSNI